MSSAVTAFRPLKQGVDPIDVVRERFNQQQARHRQKLNGLGFATVLTREPTDAQLRAAQTPQKLEALAVSCTRPVNFATASLVHPRRYPRVAAR
jgi:hypothetical protein